MYKNIQDLKFLDFCSGIGGGRIALENLGMTCLGFSEIDKDAEITYREFNDILVKYVLHLSYNKRRLR